MSIGRFSLERSKREETADFILGFSVNLLRIVRLLGA